MSMDSTDDKFGLPKPDFQALPRKKVIWPLLVVGGVVAILITAKMGYSSYIKMVGQKNATPAAEAAHNRPTTGQVTDTSSASAASPLAHASEERTNVHGAVDQSISEDEVFEHKKNIKIKESISATQKQLAIKQSKPLVKPGTYQVLKEPQGIYHLVVVSHLDKRLAMKVVQQLIKKQLGVCLILPRINKGEKYYRVTIGHSRTQYEADEKLKQFKPIYHNIFILKY